MNDKIRQELFNLGDEKYKKFSSNLIPNSKPIIGVRIPVLRKFAKEHLNDWKSIVTDTTKDLYFEETMLRGMMLGYGSSKEKNIDEALRLLDEFVPMVDNWSVCDGCCVSFTIFERHKERVFENIQRYLNSDKEFEVRVGLIILLDHFLKVDGNGNKAKRKRVVSENDIEASKVFDENGLYIDKILDIINRQYTQGYYAMMAAAWLTAECFVVFPAKTYTFLKATSLQLNNRENNIIDDSENVNDKIYCMDKVTFNKALQKICESLIPDDNVKKLIKQLKVK